MMYALDKSINKLNVYASLQDRTIRSANKMNELGFKEAADFLLKVAQEPLLEALPEGISPQPGMMPGAERL